MKYLIILLSLSLLKLCINTIASEELIYESESLKVYQVTSTVFRHVSYLETQSFGKVACNGMIYMKNQEAAVFDTPPDDLTSAELIQFINDSMSSEIIGLIINHFHVDCLGGIKEFSDKNIPSHILSHGAQLAKKEGNDTDFETFESEMSISVGGTMIHNRFFGEGHTTDNIISYVLEEKIMFGGCMVKSIGSGKGNLADANVDEWPKTIKKIKKTYPDVEIIIPGHGNIGSIELLDFTIKVFSN